MRGGNKHFSGKGFPHHPLGCFLAGGCFQLPKTSNFSQEKETVSAGTLGDVTGVLCMSLCNQSLEMLPVTLRLQETIDLRLNQKKMKRLRAARCHV